MSNEVYDEFCRASIPNLTILDRQLLGHYCTRFNETVVPPRAWPPLSELKRITSSHEKSISRSLGKLYKQGFLVRVTLANKERGRRAEYAVNRELIRSFIQVTDELPIKDVSGLQVTEETPLGNSVIPISNPSVPKEEPCGYPKPNKPIKPIKRNNEINYERWHLVTSGLKENVKSFINPAPNTELLLDKLERRGTRLETVRDVLAKVNFSTSHKIGGLFVKTLEDLVGVKSARDNSAVPWCGECDKETRQFAEASIINGVETFNCPTCSPYAKQLKIRRDVEPNEFQKRISNLLKSVED